MTKPYVPFYKPLGMSDRTYRQEIRKAEQRLAQWKQQQEMENNMDAKDFLAYCASFDPEYVSEQTAKDLIKQAKKIKENE